MTKSNLLAAAAVLTVSALAGFAAKANPIYVGYSINGGSIIQSGTSGNDGTAALNVTDSGFTIQLRGTGAPTLAQGTLFTNTLVASSSTAGTLTLYVSQLGNTNTPISFTTGFSNNSDSTVSVLETTYATDSSSSSSPFATTYQLSQAMIAPGQAIGAPTVGAPAGLTSPFSETETYLVTFPASGGTLDATLSLRTTNAIPEPVSLALLGTGLIGVSLVRRRRKAS